MDNAIPCLIAFEKMNTNVKLHSIKARIYALSFTEYFDKADNMIENEIKAITNKYASDDKFKQANI